MSYDRTELVLFMTCGQTKWHWCLEDGQGEHIAHGSHADFSEAAAEGRKAFDHALQQATP